MLAVRNTIASIRKKDLESNAELLAVELRPESKRKLLAVVFYRPPNSDPAYIKEFNLPYIDWATGTATTSDDVHGYFTKIVRDNYLWQLVTFPTRINNILDLILTNVPDKIANLEGFEDIFITDHKILSFELNLRIRRTFKAKRTVFNFKGANWLALKELLLHTPWESGLLSKRYQQIA